MKNLKKFEDFSEDRINDTGNFVYVDSEYRGDAKDAFDLFYTFSTKICKPTN